ncbi:MAG: gliding motility lipoprotein GldH [Flavobacteriaceae bacterium]|nr:gliding motility lipoprotein GldH [Flavobacteriaceae bacterium]
MQIKNTLSVFGKIILFFIAIISISSCSNNMIFDEYQSIENNKWQKDTIISFIFSSNDTIGKSNININIRNNKDYEFSNLFLIVGIKFPNNYQIVDTLEYEMTTPEGHFLGTGFSDIKENKLEYKTNVNFPVKGDYKISVQQAMRKTKDIDGLVYLNGITDVGVQIEKIK